MTYIMRLTVVFLSLLAFAPLMGAEDAYHIGLRQQLKSEFGITGGSWVIADNEDSVFSVYTNVGLNTRVFDWNGDEPFAKGMRLEVTELGQEPWENTIRINTRNGILKGDVLLLVVWTRRIFASLGISHVAHIVEQRYEPWTGSLQYEQSPQGIWVQLLVPFIAEEDQLAGQARYQLDLGYIDQIVEIGGLAILNFGSAYTVEELPSTVNNTTYEGREVDAPWRAEAQSRIEKHRKGTMKILVKDNTGKPVPGVHLKVNMQRHEFGFGTAVYAYTYLGSGVNDSIYRKKLRDLTGDGRSFNSMVFEVAMKWDQWEDENWPCSKEELVEIISQFKQEGYSVRGHNLIWPAWRWMPDDLEQNKANQAYLTRRIKDRITETAGYPGIKGELYEWDVINEPVHETDLADAYETELIYADWFKWVREADSNAVLYINDFSVLSSGGRDFDAHRKLKEIIAVIDNNGGEVGGVGMQSHMNFPLTPPKIILAVLDSFALLGKDISITEYDASKIEDSLAGDYMRDFLTAVFSHPSVKNFIMWGFWDGKHWNNNAPIFYQDWTLKPSGSQFIDLVFSKWWTRDSGITTNTGAYSLSAFYGKYTIDAMLAGQSKGIDVKFSSESEAIEIQLDTVVSGARLVPQGLKMKLLDYQINPDRTAMTISFQLTSASKVYFHMITLQGKTIHNKVLPSVKAGVQEVTINVDNFKPGIYFINLNAYKKSVNMPVLLLK